MARGGPSASRAAILTASLIALTALALSGCGGTGSLLQRGDAHRVSNVPVRRIPGFGDPAIPTPPPTRATASPLAVATIRAWSSALRRGDVRSAAGYFNLPSELINGVGGGGLSSLTLIHTRTEAERVNETLPCGARFISADQRGRYVNALFRLTRRPGPGGSDCGSGAGQTARTNFLIVHGRIVEWIRAPDDPGDNGGPGSYQGGGPLV